MAKRTLDFGKAIYDFYCPICGGEIYWKENAFDYGWISECCGKKFYMLPKKVTVEIRE